MGWGGVGRGLQQGEGYGEGEEERDDCAHQYHPKEFSSKELIDIDAVRHEHTEARREREAKGRGREGAKRMVVCPCSYCRTPLWLKMAEGRQDEEEEEEEEKSLFKGRREGAREGTA